MRGRAMYVTRGYMLRGEKVNGIQHNWSAGLGRPSDESPPKKSKKRRKNKKLKKAAKAVAKSHACSICNQKFRTPGGRDDHAKTKHPQKAVEASRPTSQRSAPAMLPAPESVKAAPSIPLPVTPVRPEDTKTKFQLLKHLRLAHIGAAGLPPK
jgi:hypothetical protein